MAEGSRGYEFGDYRLDVARHSLYSCADQAWTPLTPRVFDTLLFLLEHPGELLDKASMMTAIWPDVVVEENNLDQNISTLRRALGERRGEQRYIVTVRGRGYRFAAPVRKLTATELREPVPGGTNGTSGSGGSAAAGPSARPAFLRKHWLLWATAGLAAIAVGAVAMLLHESEPSPRRATATQTLAVLPFRPLTVADRNESLELGMADTLIMRLNTPGLVVRPLSAVRGYADPGQDAVLAGRALDVDAVLEGYLQRNGDRLRVSARLINVADGRQLWAERYDERFTDIFGLQDTIATKVWTALTPDLADEVPPTLKRYTDDADAYQMYLSGRFYRQRGNEAGLREALGLFQQAVERDPDFALAYVGLADVFAVLGVFGIVAPHDTFPQAREAVDKALDLAPQLGEAHASLGHIKVQYELDWAGAEQAYRRSIELNPNYAPAQQWFGLYLALAGQFEEGLERMRNAQALEPSSPVYAALIGMLLNYQRRYDEAIDQLEQTIEMDPFLPTARTYLAVSYLRRGEYELALEHLRQVSSSTPGSRAYLGQIFALSGRRGEAEAEVERLIDESRHRYVSAYDISTIYAALGNTDETFAWLERAFDERSQLIAWVPWDPVFDGMRMDPRYSRLVRQLSADVQGDEL